MFLYVHTSLLFSFFRIRILVIVIDSRYECTLFLRIEYYDDGMYAEWVAFVLQNGKKSRNRLKKH